MKLESSFIILSVLLVSQGSLAQENSDLDLIPKAISKKIVESTNNPEKLENFKQKIFLEKTATTWSNKSNLLVPVPTAQSNYQSLTSLDYLGEYRANDQWVFYLSNKLNFIYDDSVTYPSQANYRNDLRELYLSAEVSPNLFIGAGRVNARKGVALGFNPTDFFKPRSAVIQSSIDPSATKENRLGVLQFQLEKIFENSSVSFSFAPTLQSASPIINAPTSTFDPRFGQTNYCHRGLLTMSADFFDLAPQLLIFSDDQGAHLGLSASHVTGTSFVFYLEWAGANSQNLTTRALQFGQKTGSLPLGIPNLPQTNTLSFFQNDVSLGGSWTSSEKFTINLEYHYHQAGLTQDDFSNWNALGSSSSLLVSQLWYVRQYANDQQEPLTQSEFFIRLDYPDLFFNHHNLDLVSFINSFDGSSVTQLSSQYQLSEAWTFAGYFTVFAGGPTTVYGSLPVNNSLSGKVSYYF